MTAAPLAALFSAKESNFEQPSGGGSSGKGNISELSCGMNCCLGGAFQSNIVDQRVPPTKAATTTTRRQKYL
jgi:hypothetical protein